jgi:signal transduction histidine kinase/ligand-binding sensor domain-containing protein
MNNFLLSLLMVACGLLPELGRAAGIDLQHTSWTARDGAPAMILAITQDRDGWLWLGGPTGLYRFDGIQFEQFTPANAPLLTRNVSVVNARADGALWIGYRTGGVSLLQGGRIRNYDARDGLPGRAVWSVEQDSSGRTWAATAQGMFYLENERWQTAGPEWELASGWYKTLMRDRQGVLWAQGDAGVYALRPGATHFSKAPVESGTGVLFNLPNGSVVSWDAAKGRFHQLAGAGPDASARLPQHLGDPTSLLFDRDGHLWAGFKEGLEYHGAQGVARTAPPQGLSGRSVSAMFQDREGNIWAATFSGVDRFRRSRLHGIALPQSAIGAAIAADDSGGAWIGGYHVSVDASGQTRLTPLWPAGSEGWENLLNGFSRGRDGVLWGAAYGAVRRVQGRDSRKIALPAEAGGVVTQTVLAEPDGSVLVTTRRPGLYRLKPNGEWERNVYPGEVSVMARSDAAGLWLGSYPAQVAHLDGTGWRSYGAEAGLNIGLVMALHLNGQRLWAGGDNGLALFDRDRDRFRRIGGVNGENFDGISGIVELDNGDLWLNALSGLFRIPAAEIARFNSLPDYRVRYELLDQHDGIEGSAPRVAPSPSMVLASDGRLWVVRSTGVFRFNPAEALPPAPLQPVLIKRIGTAGEEQLRAPALRFAAGSSALQIDYAIPSLSMPEKIRFRYRLDPIDTAWQEAGARRSAYYNNLASGDYVFRVTASDYNGHWSGQESTAHFAIAPALAETWWFRALCGALLLSIAALAYRWHMRRMARHMAERLQERAGERERIARELHDTLLQSVQGLILHVHAAITKLPPRDANRLQLERVLQQADDVVGEGRDRIGELRRHDAGQCSFPEAVRAAAARVQPDDAAPLELKILGAERQLDPAVFDESLAIVGEAVANAYTHANASRIEVVLEYGTREFHCTIRDDGSGIADAILSDGGRPNHWGMRGMAERAARINARLDLRSGAGSGTEWQLVLPASLSYTRIEGWRAALAVIRSRETLC